MALSFDNRKMLGMAEKFSGLRILAFALSGPTLGWAGLGGAELGFGGRVISTLAPQPLSRAPFCSLLLSVPRSVGLQAGAGGRPGRLLWAWSACVLLQLTYLKPLLGARSLRCGSLCCHEVPLSPVKTGIRLVNKLSGGGAVGTNEPVL